MKDERALVDELRARFHTDHDHVRVGIGDDAAVLRAREDVVLTVDVAVEDVHFRRSFATLDVIAARAFHAAVSDLAAMGAESLGALVALVLPSSLTDEALSAMLEGLARASRETDTPIVGGNTSRGPSIAITTTAIGAASAPILRSGAEIGDVLYVTGSTGDRALGLALLLGGHEVSSALEESARGAIEAWRHPRARLREGRALVGVASSAIDLSDGLAMDLHRLARASGVGARVELAALTHGPRFHDLAACIGADPAALLLEGGEAYELLFTAPKDAHIPFTAFAIGEIVEGSDVTVRAEGVEQPLVERGFDHVARGPQD